MASQDSESARSFRPRRIIVAFTAAAVMLLVTPTIVAAESYTVQPGDTLSVIARDNGVTTSELARVNGISNLHLIRVGQVLQIPSYVHTVQAGDTLSQIAAGYGIATSDLVELNGITNANLIQVGQELKLPTGASRTSADPAAKYSSLPARLVADPNRLALIPSFERWSEHYGIPTDLLMAVAYRESGWQQNVVSPKGAIGVGQLLPRTAEWLANDIIQIPDLDPEVADDNIRMSARFLSWLIGYMGGTDRALAGYYQGPTSVNRIGLYDDTEAYVTNINQIRSRFEAS